MTSVRKSHLLLWAASLAVLVWACGGGSGSPTAPASFDETGVFQGEAKCATPPCGGGNAGGGGGGGSKNNQDEIVWTISASGALSAPGQSRSLAPAESMRFDDFTFASGNSGFEQLATTGHEGFAICFSDTFYTADDLIIERDPKTNELHAVYRFGGQRLDGSREITYEIVFRQLQIRDGSWIPGVGSNVFSTDQYDVRGVAQKNNTCSGSGTLPLGEVEFTLVGAAP